MYIYLLATLLYLNSFSEGDVIVLGSKRLCRHILAHGETKKSGKTVIFDRPATGPPRHGCTAFYHFFDVFQVKEMMQNHGFSNNAQSVLKYFTLIIS